MGVKNFERLLITIPECILNPNQIDFGLGLSPGWGPKPNIYIFLGEMSTNGQFLLKIA